ncbi:MAG: hypothetical protein P8Y27_04940, partial [Chromatiaceae bacterium]
AQHWQECVRRALGTRFEPTLEHGAKVTSIGADTTYLAKLGLEIAGITTKATRLDGHRTSWGVARDAADGDRASQRLWSEYVQHTHGTRLMTWSRGTKRQLGIVERTDQEIVDDETTEASARQLVASYDSDEWDRIVHEGRDLEVLRAAADGELIRFAIGRPARTAS